MFYVRSLALIHPIAESLHCFFNFLNAQTLQSLATIFLLFVAKSNCFLFLFF